MGYNFKDIEKKWQDKWYSEGTFYAKDNKSMPKWFGLIEFPFPSALLVTCRRRSYTASCRFRPGLNRSAHGSAHRRASLHGPLLLLSVFCGVAMEAEIGMAINGR